MSEIPPTPSAVARDLVVLDLDGVLADVRHRLRHVEGRTRHWDRFFEASAHDPLLEEGARVLRLHAQEFEVVVCTGRPAAERRRTEEWMERVGLECSQLWMRPDGDRTPGHVLKPDLISRLAGGRKVRLVVEDDAKTCSALSQAGFEVMRARWMRNAPRVTGPDEPTGVRSRERERALERERRRDLERQRGRRTR